MEATDKPTLHGLMAEFETPEELMDAAKEAYAAGYRQMDAYTPFPVEGLSEAMGHKWTILPALVLGGGIAGAVGGYLMQYYLTVIDYPINVGGRPLHSWPSFIPITFELAILLAAGTAVVGMILLNGLPRPYHPVFNAPGFERASQDRFFLCIESGDEQFDAAATRAFLESRNPASVTEVEA